jgi:hypothetical protein
LFLHVLPQRRVEFLPMKFDSSPSLRAQVKK